MKSAAREKFLQGLSIQLKALWIFFPGIIFLILGLFVFVKIQQGQDIIYQSTDKLGWLTGIYIVLATIFWVFTTWYTARLIAYDRDDIYEKAPGVLSQFPRLLAFSIFLLLWLAIFLISDHEHKLKVMAWIAVISDFILYYLFYYFFELPLKKIISPGTRNILSKIRIGIWMLIAACCVAIVIAWGYNYIDILLWTLPFLQFGFLFLLVVRKPMYDSNLKPSGSSVSISSDKKVKDFWLWYVTIAFKKTNSRFDFKFEKPVFIIYHILAFLALPCYLLSINYLAFARGLTSFPLVLLAFGFLLGIINLLALVSRRNGINLSFIILVIVLIGSWTSESHEVRILRGDGARPGIYHQRDSFEQYVAEWVSWHSKAIDDDKSGHFPVFFVLADGGASRSGYWAALVLAKLHEGTRDTGTSHSYFADHLICLSGASGGSVGNAGFLAAYAIQQRNPRLRTDSLCNAYLRNDFLVYPLGRLLGPDLIKPAFGWLKFWQDRAGALEYGMEHPEKGSEDMARWMQGSFSQLIPDSINRLPMLSMNSTRVNDANPAMISTVSPKENVFGGRLDILDILDSTEDMRLSTAMVLGARFPYLSPGGKLGKNSYFVDGGYFDNSGAGPVHEMLLQLQKMQKNTNKDDSVLTKRLQKMDFYVFHLSNTPNIDTSKKKKDRINPIVNDIATPILTLAGSYSSQTNINDARLTNYLAEVNAGRPGYMVFNLYKDKSDLEPISMNWVISQRALAFMNERLDYRISIDSLISRMNKPGPKTNLFEGLLFDHNKGD